MKKKTDIGCEPTRSECPVSQVLDLLGDKWTLIVIRDMMIFEKKLYKELADSEECIPTNILADRLKKLEAHGLLNKTRYQDNPPRHAYQLTAKGLDLFPILKELIAWGKKHLPGLPRRDPEFLKMVERRIQRQRRAKRPA